MSWHIRNGSRGGTTVGTDGNDMTNLRARFWAEALIGGAAAIALVAFLLWPNWVESVFEASPDGGSGALELAIVVVLFATSLCCSILMRAEVRRSDTAMAAG